jgi:hypothetical protein
MFLDSPVFVELTNGFGTNKRETCIDAIFLFDIF